MVGTIVLTSSLDFAFQFCIIDDENLLTGSLNWSGAVIRNHD